MKFFPGISLDAADALKWLQIFTTSGFLSNAVAAKLNHSPSSEEITTYISGIVLWLLYYAIMVKLYINHLKLPLSFFSGGTLMILESEHSTCFAYSAICVNLHETVKGLHLGITCRKIWIIQL